MEGVWPIIWLMVALKIPLLAALWIVWWALRAEPAGADEEQRPGGEGDGPHRPRPSLPSAPRRGAHSESRPSSPRRVRVASRRRTRAHR